MRLTLGSLPPPHWVSC